MQVLVSLFVFFEFHSMVCRDGKVLQTASSLLFFSFFLIIIWSGCRGWIRRSVYISKSQFLTYRSIDEHVTLSTNQWICPRGIIDISGLIWSDSDCIYARSLILLWMNEKELSRFEIVQPFDPSVIIILSRGFKEIIAGRSSRGDINIFWHVRINSPPTV